MVDRRCTSLEGSSSPLDRHPKPGLEVCTVHWEARRKRGCIGIPGQYLLANSSSVSAASCDISEQFLVTEGGQANRLTFRS